MEFRSYRLVGAHDVISVRLFVYCISVCEHVFSKLYMCVYYKYSTDVSSHSKHHYPHPPFPTDPHYDASNPFALGPPEEAINPFAVEPVAPAPVVQQGVDQIWTPVGGRR